jgi:alpha-D-ribose 1-methylphosphonate 5-triphosphate synthase subunit PhnI
MYVAVKGGEKAIENAHRLLADRRRGDPALPEITDAQVTEQLSIAVARVMAEGSVYDRDLAARAIRQARGDLIEAIFLVRAYRTTLPRIGYSEPIDTAAMEIERRVSATFKDIPGGQVLGPTFDYTHRLLDFANDDPEQPVEAEAETAIDAPHVMALLRRDGLVEDSLDDKGMVSPAEQVADGAEHENAEAPIADLTRQSLNFPADRDLRLQNLARGDEGFLLALGYSTQRGYGRTHPFVGEIRYGEVEVELFAEELGFAVPLGEIDVTECELVNQFTGSAEAPPQFTRGYGLVFGQSERKAMSMALVDRALRADEFGEERTAPAQDEEFVLSHSDNVQATGFVEHLKLPHYVDFQAELALLRQLRKEHDERHAATGQEAAE